MTKKDKARLAALTTVLAGVDQKAMLDRISQLISLGTDASGEELAELAVLQGTTAELAELLGLLEIAKQEASAETAGENAFEGCTSVITMRDSKAQRIFFKAGKEVGAEDVA